MTPFEFVSEQLEARTSLSRLEVRGTLRIALRDAGLDARAATRELAVVLRKLMPEELATRGIEDAGALCESVASAVEAQLLEVAEAAERPEAVFERLVGGSSKER